MNFVKELMLEFNFHVLLHFILLISDVLVNGFGNIVKNSFIAFKGGNHVSDFRS